MNFDSMLGTVGIYVFVISALAFGVERVMDLFKTFAWKHLVRKLPQDKMNRKEREAYYKKEDSRQRRVRVYAVVVGLVLAFIAQVDTFDILGLRSPYWFGYPVLGYALSGLAASRGSAFWHDVIDLVRGIKEEKSKLAKAMTTGEDRAIASSTGEDRATASSAV